MAQHSRWETSTRSALAGVRAYHRVPHLAGQHVGPQYAELELELELERAKELAKDAPMLDEVQSQLELVLARLRHPSSPGVMIAHALADAVQEPAARAQLVKKAGLGKPN